MSLNLELDGHALTISWPLHSHTEAQGRRTRVLSGKPPFKRKREEEAGLSWVISPSRFTNQISNSVPFGRRKWQEMATGRKMSKWWQMFLLSNTYSIYAQLFTQLQCRIEWTEHEPRIWADVGLHPSLLTYSETGSYWILSLSLTLPFPSLLYLVGLIPECSWPTCSLPWLNVWLVSNFLLTSTACKGNERSICSWE